MAITKTVTVLVGRKLSDDNYGYYEVSVSRVVELETNEDPDEVIKATTDEIMRDVRYSLSTLVRKTRKKDG